MKRHPFRDHLAIKRILDPDTAAPQIQLGFEAEGGESVHFVVDLHSAEELALLILQLCSEARVEARLPPMPRLGTN